MGTSPRWFTHTGPEHSQWYIERFRKMAADGVDLGGEARLLDAMIAPGSPEFSTPVVARVGLALSSRRVDTSSSASTLIQKLIAAAESDHPGPTWLVADLAELNLAAEGVCEPFDAAILAGNVMTFVGPGTERTVLSRVGSHVRPDGVILVGFGTDRGYAIADFDRDVGAAGLLVEHRFATWDLRPWSADAAFAVSVLRKPEDGPF